MILTGVRLVCPLVMVGGSMWRNMRLLSVCPWILTMGTGGTPGNNHSGSRKYHGREGIVYFICIFTDLIIHYDLFMIYDEY